MRFSSRVLLILSVSIIGCTSPKKAAPEVTHPGTSLSERAEDAKHWESAISSLEAKDQQGAPADAVLFVGSSSIRHWDTNRSFPDIATINRGFGGSCISDATHFIDRIVLPYEPRLIVLYAGDNDIAAGKSPQQVYADFHIFVNAVRQERPDTPILFIAIKPSLARWSYWPKMREANTLIEQYTETDPTLAYVDIATPMLDAQGRPRGELFGPDELHLNAAGYAMWTEILQQAIVAF